MLKEGKVQLRLNRASEPDVSLEPGELLSYSAGSGLTMDKRKVKPDPMTSWKDGILQFEDVPLSRVMERIEEIYGWRAVYNYIVRKTSEDARSRHPCLPTTWKAH